MTTLTINGAPVSVEEGATLLEAARKAGAFVPTLCFLEGNPHRGSCMVCAVREAGSNRILPACVARAEEGMAVETEGPAVQRVRQGALNLLFSDHEGECEGPCALACPAGLDMPRMLRLITAGEWDEACAVLRNQCALPGTVALACHAPCEKACRLGHAESHLRLQSIHRLLARRWLTMDRAAFLRPAPPSGRRVAVVGGGPAGLAAADYLARQGHACTVFDDQPQAGGMLRQSHRDREGFLAALDAEIGDIAALGVEFRLDTAIGKGLPLDTLLRDFDAVILALGELHAHNPLVHALERTPFGFRAEKAGGQTGTPKLFAAGGCVRPSRHAARSTAQGRYVAAAVDRFLVGIGDLPHPLPFRSRFGRLSGEELARLFPRLADRAAGGGGLPPVEDEAGAAAEAARCLRCGCLKADRCRLREYAALYHVSQKRYRTTPPHPPAPAEMHAGVVFEPGKCIKCGRCVVTTRDRQEALGLAFVGRGYDMRVGVPFDEPLSSGLEKSAALCAERCPTGAIAPTEGEPPGNGEKA